MEKIIFHEKDLQKTIDQIIDFAVDALSKYSKEKLEDMYQQYIDVWSVSDRFYRAYPFYDYDKEQEMYDEINRRLGTDMDIEIYLRPGIRYRHWCLGLMVWWGKKNHGYD